MIVLIFIAGILGIVFGTQFTWEWQIGAAVAFYIIMESPQVRSMEIGAIIPMAFGIYFLGGMIIGDISWFIQTWDTQSIEYTNPFIVNP